VLECFKLGLLALIAHSLHPLKQALFHSHFDCCVLWIAGKVVPFIRVFFDIVELFGRPVLVAANFFRGVGVGLSLLPPGFEDARISAGVLELYFRREIPEVFELGRTNRTDAEIIGAVVYAAGRHLAEDVLFVLCYLAFQDR